jgi:hypothetical protein
VTTQWYFREENRPGAPAGVPHGVRDDGPEPPEATP